MKRFVKIVGITCCFAQILWTGVELYQPHVLNEYTYKVSYLDKQGTAIRTLILGNSYASWSIDPSYLGDSCFNAATSGRWIYFDRRILENYIDKMPNLKTVIYPLGYKIPFVGLAHHINFVDDKSEWITYSHRKYMNISYNGILPMKNYLISSVFGLGLDKINVGSLTDNYVGCTNGYIPQKGCFLDEYPYEDTISIHVMESTYAQLSIREFFVELSLINNICHFHNVQFCVVIPPLNSKMRNAICVEAKNLVGEQIRLLQRSTQFPFLYIDYSTDLEFQIDSLYFNSDHLNTYGARSFAMRLYQDCVK